LRHASNEAMRAQWEAEATATLDRIGIQPG